MVIRGGVPIVKTVSFVGYFRTHLHMRTSLFIVSGLDVQINVMLVYGCVKTDSSGVFERVDHINIITETGCITDIELPTSNSDYNIHGFRQGYFLLIPSLYNKTVVLGEQHDVFLDIIHEDQIPVGEVVLYAEDAPCIAWGFQSNDVAEMQSGVQCVVQQVVNSVQDECSIYCEIYVLYISD